MLDIHYFVHASWDIDLDQKMFTSGYVFKVFGGEINWMNKRQSIVVLSTIKFKYMVGIYASK